MSVTAPRLTAVAGAEMRKVDLHSYNLNVFV